MSLSTAPVPASGTKPPTTASLSTMAPRSAPALASQEEEGLLRLQVSGSSTHRAGPPPSATNTVCWACPDRVEGYGQLCANLGGPDAVEGVFQLHSPAKRRHRAVIEAKRPTENPHLLCGLQSKPLLLVPVGEEDTGVGSASLWPYRTRCTVVRCLKASASSLGAS